MPVCSRCGVDQPADAFSEESQPSCEPCYEIELDEEAAGGEIGNDDHDHDVEVEVEDDTAIDDNDKDDHDDDTPPPKPLKVKVISRLVLMSMQHYEMAALLSFSLSSMEASTLYAYSSMLGPILPTRIVASKRVSEMHCHKRPPTF
jgi:hypothetical protein